MRAIIFAAVASVALGYGSSVQAGPLGPPTAFGNVGTSALPYQARNEVTDQELTASFGSFHEQTVVTADQAGNSGAGYADVSAQGGTSPSVSARAQTPTIFTASATSGIQVSYQAEIIGPADIMVPVLVTATGTAYANPTPGSVSADGHLLIGSFGVPQITGSLCVGICADSSPYAATLAISDLVQFYTNQIISITIKTDATSGSGADTFGSNPSGTDAYAFVSSQLTLDPAAIQAGYSIIYSDGVLDVPEPVSSLAWLSMSLIVLRKAARKRKV